MNKRAFSFVTGACFMLFALQAEAQQAGNIPRMGYVSGRGDPTTLDPQFEAFRQGLRDLGYVEQPKKFELVTNLKTAKQIGVTIAPEVLYRADKVIR